MTIAASTQLICFLVLSSVVVLGALGVVLLSRCLLMDSFNLQNDRFELSDA